MKTIKLKDKKKKKFFCKVGLHWPLHRKHKAFTDRVSLRPVYLCQCNCGKWWLAESRYSRFKVESEKPYAWIVNLGEAEKLFT